MNAERSRFAGMGKMIVTGPKIRFTALNDPAVAVEFGATPFFIGRNKDCEFRLDDRYVSRRQARVAFTRGAFVVENLGRNPLKVNDRPETAYVLQEGDILRVGLSQFVVTVTIDELSPSSEHEDDPRVPIRAEDPLEGAEPPQLTQKVSRPGADGTSEPEATTLSPVLTRLKLGPRLVLVGASQRMELYPLTVSRITIGRVSQCGIRLEGETVSRIHAAVEKRSDGFYAVSLSTTNPMLINDRVAKEERIYNGDNLQIGNHVFTFVSDREEDVRPAEERVVIKERGPSRMVLGVVAVLLVAMGWVLADHFVVRPWRVQAHLYDAENLIRQGAHEQAVSSLKQLLADRLNREQAERARQLMAESVLARARAFADEKRLLAAQELLVEHLADYGVGAVAKPLRRLLDRIRYDLGWYFEENKDFKRAMQEYLAVGSNSPLYDQAQRAVSRLWLDYQQTRLKQSSRSSSVTELLRRAEEHFSQRRYLVPATNNAYNLYRAVLAIEPQNTIALERVEHMKIFYRTEGDKHFDLKQCDRSLMFYQRYLLIDPGSDEVKDRIDRCQRPTGGIEDRREPAPSPKSTAAREQGAEQERIRRALADSGVHSEWIIQYLFEGKGTAEETETPW